MIPKIIHYCWFGGGKKPAIFETCFASWKKYCPGYEIKEWNEKNFDVRQNQFLEEAYDKHQYAFVCDLARLIIVKKYGGIYLDIDVELIKPLESLLKYDFFAGLDERGLCNTGEGFGAIPGHPYLDVFMKEYNHPFVNSDGKTDDVPCPTKNQKSMESLGFTNKQEEQIIGNTILFPRDYLCPICYSQNDTHFTDNTISVHHYDASWRTRRAKITFKIAKGEKLTFTEKIIVMMQKIKKFFKKLLGR